MAVLLSPVGGVAAQFFDSNGNPLSGGFIYTYAAGTSTPQATYTTAAANIQHSNPIQLDAAGRVPSGEIWLVDGESYKFVIKDANFVLIGTYDNIVGINSNVVSYVNQQEIQTATAGQTVFVLTQMTYNPGTNSLSVFVDGVNQYGPGAQYAYLETGTATVTFLNPLNAGSVVKFTMTQVENANVTDASQVSYKYPATTSIAESVQDKLQQCLSVKDFGAVGDGVTDDSSAINAATLEGKNTGQAIYFPAGTYVCKNLYLYKATKWYGDGYNTCLQLKNAVGASDWFVKNFNCGTNVNGSDAPRIDNYIEIENIRFDGNKANQTQVISTIYWRCVEYSRILNCHFQNASGMAFDSCNNINHIWMNKNFFQNNDGVDISVRWVSNRFIITDNIIIGSNVYPEDGGEGVPATSNAIEILNQNITGSSNFDCAENIIANNVIKGKINAVKLDGPFETLIANNIMGNQQDSSVVAVQTGTYFPQGLTISHNHITNENAAGTGASINVIGKRVNISNNVMISNNADQIDINTDDDNAIINITANNIQFPSQQDNGCGILLRDVPGTIIANNNILFPRVGIYAAGTSIGVETWGLSILNNTISNASRQGILISDNGVNRKYRNTTVNGNTIQNNSLRSANADDAILFEQVAGVIDDVHVDSNTIWDYNGNCRNAINFVGTINKKVVEPNQKVFGINGVIVNGYYSSAPADGAYYAGQRIYNFAPTSGGTEGWICTVSGSSGTWKTFGSIS